MSFLKKLFGLGGGAAAGAPAAPAKEAASVEHAGFTIKATPFPEGGQQQLCGVIEKEIDGELKSYRFVRADRFASVDDAAEAAIRKGRQIVDEQGEKLFAQSGG